MEPLEILKKLYKEEFGIDESIVDLMADRDILHLTATGSSINSTSRFLDIDEDDIKITNNTFYGFDGWDKDLDLNPFGIYMNIISSGYWDYDTFSHEISVLSPYSTLEIIQLMYEVCCKFYTIEKLIDEEWK